MRNYWEPENDNNKPEKPVKRYRDAEMVLIVVIVMIGMLYACAVTGDGGKSLNLAQYKRPPEYTQVAANADVWELTQERDD